uniref:Uncharacterized protein n=1 Tax=Arundo donax TaxID=35708 RepID=A0A0A9ABM0_ARUDO
MLICWNFYSAYLMLCTGAHCQFHVSVVVLISNFNFLSPQLCKFPKSCQLPYNICQMN